MPIKRDKDNKWKFSGRGKRREKEWISPDEDGSDGMLPDGWGDWTDKEKEDWLSYPDGKKKKKKRKSYTRASAGPVGMMPKNYGGKRY